MNLTLFSREHYNITLLNSFEIENPRQALKELLAGNTVQEMKRRTEELMLSAIRPIGWRQLGAPIYLYQTYKEINKMLELTWLLCRQLPGADNDDISLKTYTTSKQYEHGTFPELFKDVPSKTSSTDISALQLMKAMFNNHHQLFLKSYTECWMYVGLNTSYMSNLSHDFYCADSYMETEAYRSLMTLIEGAFELLNEPDNSDHPAASVYHLFSNDHDHPTMLYEETLENLAYAFESPHFYIESSHIPAAIIKWFSLIRNQDHWNAHNDAGNIVYLKETIETQFDAAWVCYQTEFPRLKKRQPDPKYVTQLAADEIIDPKKAIARIFKQRRLSKWKKLLETWLCQSL